MTHTSWASDRASSYERLEFLGDSVLELAVARELFERYPDFTEGQLAKIRSHVVSRASCAVVARRLGLGAQMAEQAVGVPVEWEDREFFRIPNSSADTIERVRMFLMSYRR